MTLFLHGKPGEHVRSLATLRNTGSTSLFYQWHRQPPISLLVDEPSCIVQAGDDCSRRASFFYIVPTNGCLVPGQCKEFYIEFHPCIPGSFMETWILHFSPKLVTSLPALHLRGAAAVPEDVNSTLQRKLLQLSLDTKQRSRGLEEIFGEILEKAIKEVQITFKKAPDFVVSNESFDFMRSNMECFEETPLYYNPPVHLQFQDIAAEIHTKSLANAKLDLPIDEAGSNSIASIAHTWDSSVSNLILSLDDIDVNENWKEMIQHRVSCLQLQAAIPPHPTALLYTAMYKALVKIVSDVEEVMEGDCKKLGETLSTFEMQSSSNVELGFAKSLESSPFKETSGNANVGENSGMVFGSSSAKQTSTNATKVQQVEAMKTSESGPSRGSMGNANVGSSSSKQVVVKENVRQADSLKGSSSKQVTAGVKEGGIRENPNRETAEQAGIDEMENRISYEERVRTVLQEGVVEGFLKNVDTAFAKLVLVVQKKIECCMAEGDEISASWLSLWFTRLSHAITYH